MVTTMVLYKGIIWETGKECGFYKSEDGSGRHQYGRLRINYLGCQHGINNAITLHHWCVVASDLRYLFALFFPLSSFLSVQAVSLFGFLPMETVGSAKNLERRIQELQVAARVWASELALRLLTRELSGHSTTDRCAVLPGQQQYRGSGAVQMCITMSRPVMDMQH